MSRAADAIVKKITATPHLRMTEAEAQVLLAEPAPTLMMKKLLGVHLFQNNDLRAALVWARQVFEAEPSAESAKNVSVILRKTGDLEAALAFTRAQKDLFEPIMWHDAMCMTCTLMGRFDEAVAHGTSALRLKDEAAGTGPRLTPVTRPFDIEAKARNVIALSLWGQDPRYLTGIQHNAIVARYLYPGWTMRVYTDRSVPEPVLKGLVTQGADVRIVPETLPAARYGLFWRFLVEDDPGVDRYMVRDADSVMNIREAAAVADWIASGRAFHVIRDYPAHSELILAGMWGAQRGNLGRMRTRIEAHVEDGARQLNNRITDQEFLRTEIWPTVKQDVCMHDAWFDFGTPVRLGAAFALPRDMHIGQNDDVARRRGKGA